LGRGYCVARVTKERERFLCPRRKEEKVEWSYERRKKSEESFLRIAEQEKKERHLLLADNKKKKKKNTRKCSREGGKKKNISPGEKISARIGKKKRNTHFFLMGRGREVSSLYIERKGENGGICSDRPCLTKKGGDFLRTLAWKGLDRCQTKEGKEWATLGYTRGWGGEKKKGRFNSDLFYEEK